MYCIEDLIKKEPKVETNNDSDMNTQETGIFMLL